MTNKVRLNLPVKELNKTKKFFAQLGFSFATQHGNGDNSGCFMVGKDKFHVLLFPENTFKGFTKNELTNTAYTTEVLISPGAESREEVDEMARKVFEAGGTVYNAPEEIDGWMDGCGFADPNGHRRNVPYVDFSKMSKASDKFL